MASSLPDTNRPRHIAIIMDGNGRWAEAHGKKRHTGHRAGVRTTRNIVEYAGNIGIEALTLFAFSSENWSRPAEEVSSLMSLFFEVLQREVELVNSNDVSSCLRGCSASLLPPKLRRRATRAWNLRWRLPMADAGILFRRRAGWPQRPSPGKSLSMK